MQDRVLEVDVKVKGSECVSKLLYVCDCSDDPTLIGADSSTPSFATNSAFVGRTP